MRLTEFLNLSEKLERTVSDCYRKLASFCAKPAVRDKLNKIADEEIRHANAIAAARSYARKMPVLFGEPIPPTSDLEAGLEAAKKLDRDIVDVASLRDKFRRLSLLESQFEKIHIDVSVDFKDERLKVLFQNFSGDDKKHAESLVEIMSRCP